MVKTRSGAHKMDLTDELRDYLDARFDQLLTRLATKDDINSLRNEVTKLISDSVEAQGKIISSLETKVEQLEAENVVLKKHVSHLLEVQDDHEQYSRRLCLRIDGIGLPLGNEHETSESCLKKVKELFKKMEVDIPDATLDRAHRIGPKKTVNGVTKQQVIVRLTTWRHRTAIYRARSKAGNVKIRLDLTRKKLSLLNAANTILKDYNGHYAFADVNCRIRVKINDKFFSISSIEELNTLLSENAC